MKRATPTQRRHAEIRALVQRTVRDTQKKKNLCRLFAAGIKGEHGSGWSHPPVALWAPPEDGSESARVDPTELALGTGICKVTVVTGTHVIAIDGETQMTAWHEIAENPATEVMFERVCRENGINQRLTKPRSPTTTGKIERFHKTLRREMLDHSGPFADPVAAQTAIDAWVHGYNHTRPHQSLEMATPAQVFRPHTLPADAPETTQAAAAEPRPSEPMRLPVGHRLPAPQRRHHRLHPP